MKQFAFYVIFLLGLTLCGAKINLVQNGDFSQKLQAWNSPKWCPAQLSSTDLVSPPYALKLIANNNGDATISQRIKLKPNTRYILTFYVKTTGVKPLRTGKLRVMGANVYLKSTNQNGKLLAYGPAGIWQYQKGDTAWSKGVFQINSKYFASPEISLSLGIYGCRGIAYFDNISLVEE